MRRLAVIHFAKATELKNKYWDYVYKFEDSYNPQNYTKTISYDTCIEAEVIRLGGKIVGQEGTKCNKQRRTAADEHAEGLQQENEKLRAVIEMLKKARATTRNKNDFEITQEDLDEGDRLERIADEMMNEKTAYEKKQEREADARTEEFANAIDKIFAK